MAATILWADDEIDLLKPHIMFLTAKGYELLTVRSGGEALDVVASRHVDLVILDEHMPGITGLEALQQIKLTAPHIPVVMITKSEEEDIMDQAIGGKIADYLIKPVNPRQILSAIKKALDSPRLVAERTTDSYREAFTELSAEINRCRDIADWGAVYSRLAYWLIELDASTDIAAMAADQLTEANAAFTKDIRRNYAAMVTADYPDTPLMSHTLLRRRLFPLVEQQRKPWVVVIDNFRLDQWLAIRPMLAHAFNFETDELCCAILPTTTQYARNAIFAGLMPARIAELHPDLWIDDTAAEGKNLNEEALLGAMLRRLRRPWKFSYTKVSDSTSCQRLTDTLSQRSGNDFNVVVLNFIDMLSHARSESSALRELAQTDAAYRSITASWFRHSPALALFERIAATGSPILLTTDHGTIRVSNPVRIMAERDVSSGLRYKTGRKIDADTRRVFETRRPAEIGLAASSLTSSYIFATGADYLLYPNNYTQYVQRYNATFQHGGISLEEMLVPAVTLAPKQ